MLDFLGDVAGEFLIRKDTECENGGEDGEKSAILPHGRKVIINKRFLGEVNDKSHRVDQQNLLNICRKHLQRINNRGGIKQHCKDHFPHQDKVTQTNIERRHDEPKCQHNNIYRYGEKKKHGNGCKAWQVSIPCKERDDHHEVHEVDQGGVERRGHDNRPTRDIYFGHELGFVEKRAHACHRALGKEVEHDNRHQKLEGVVFIARSARIEEG